MFDLEPILSFLKSQPTITVWEQPNATQCSSVPHDILPQVIDVSLDPWMLPTFINLRPLIRIATKIEREDAASERQFVDVVLGVYGQSLRSLDLVRDVVEESMPIAEFISLIALKLPWLEHLSIRNAGPGMVRMPLRSRYPFNCSQLDHPDTCTSDNGIYGPEPRCVALLLSSSSYLLSVSFPTHCI